MTEPAATGPAATGPATTGPATTGPATTGPTPAAPADDLMEKVVRLCRQRGFIFPSAERPASIAAT